MGRSVSGEVEEDVEAERLRFLDELQWMQHAGEIRLRGKAEEPGARRAPAQGGDGRAQPAGRALETGEVV